MTLTAQELEAQMPDATQLLSDEPEMESSVHYAQLALLVSCLEWLWRDRQDFFIGANLTIYFSRQQIRNREFRGPDLFLVKNTERRPRKSWVVWEEDGRYPDLIIELLSESTAAVDRGLKKDLYASRFHASEYFWFSPDTLEFVGHRLVDGSYVEIEPSPQRWRWSQQLGLYLGVVARQLRYVDAAGELIPTLDEATRQAQLESQQAKIQAQQAKVEAREARQQTERLAAKLRALGVDPEADLL